MEPQIRIVVGQEQAPQPPPRRPWALIVAVAAVIAAVLLLPGMNRADEPDVALTTTTLATTSLGSEVAGWSDEIVLVVSPAGSSDRYLAIVDPDDANPQLQLLESTGWVELDASGRWIAALGADSDVTAGTVLYVGSVGGQLLPVATEVRGFAWHDSDEGRLAWSSRRPGESGWLTVADVQTGSRSTVVEVDGTRLRRWGDWGFALAVPGPEYRTELRDGSGTVLDIVRGFPLGPVPGGLGFTRLTPTDGQAPAFIRSTDGAAIASMSEFAPGEYPRARVTNSARNIDAYHVNHGGLLEDIDSSSIRIVDGSGQVAAVIDGVSRPPAMAWSTTGRHLVSVADVDGATVLRVYDAATGAINDVAINTGLGSAHVLALASRNVQSTS